MTSRLYSKSTSLVEDMKKKLGFESYGHNGSWSVPTFLFPVELLEHRKKRGEANETIAWTHSGKTPRATI